MDEEVRERADFLFNIMNWNAMQSMARMVLQIDQSLGRVLIKHLHRNVTLEDLETIKNLSDYSEIFAEWQDVAATAVLNGVGIVKDDPLYSLVVEFVHAAVRVLESTPTELLNDWVKKSEPIFKEVESRLEAQAEKSATLLKLGSFADFEKLFDEK